MKLKGWKYYNHAAIPMCAPHRRGIGLAVKELYPLRDLITGKTGIGSQISAVLRMEEIRRKC